MAKYHVGFGVTIQAYADVKIEARDEKELIAKLAEFLASKVGDEEFGVEWETADDYRIVTVVDANGETALTDECLRRLNVGEPVSFN